MLSDTKKLKSLLTELDTASSLYPREWLSLPDRPERVYALGDLSLLSAKKFALVGSRRTPAAVLKLGENIAKELSLSFALVTGTADGGDTAAIEGALSGTGRVICVLAGGFSSVPKIQLPLLERVAERGLVLAVHPFEREVRAFSYEYRNKLLAALGEGILVLSAGEKSGTLITAKYASEFKKPIFAIPYPPSSAAGMGCNALIKKGGHLTETAEDITQYFGLKAEKGKACAHRRGSECIRSTVRAFRGARIRAFEKIGRARIQASRLAFRVGSQGARGVLGRKPLRGRIKSPQTAYKKSKKSKF